MNAPREDATAEALAAFVAFCYEPGDIVELRPLPAKRGEPCPWKRRWVLADELPGLAPALAQDNAEGAQVYAGVVPRSRRNGGADADCLPGRVAWADADGETPESLLARIEELGLPRPGMAINSGHGAHAYWRLSEPQPPEDVRRLVRDIAEALGTDPSVANPSRIMRLPGLWNHKEPPAPCELLFCEPSAAVDAAELWERVAVLIEPPLAQAEPVAAPTPAKAGTEPRADAPAADRARAYVLKMDGKGKGGRTTQAFHVAAVLVNDFGLADAEALPILEAWDTLANKPPIQGDPDYPKDELSRIMANARRFAKEPHRGKLDARPAAGNGKPEVAEPDAEAPPRIRLLSSVERRPIVWLWERRIAIGKLSIVAGDPDQGKSAAVLDLAARITTGSPLPGEGARREPAGVVLLSAEDDMADTVGPRFDAAGGDSRLLGFPENDVWNLGNMALLEAYIMAFEQETGAKCRLVILDPLSCFLGKVDSHNNSEVRGVLAPLSAMAARRAVAVVCVHHFRKGGGKALHQGMGSLAFTAAARAVFGVVRDPEDQTGERSLWGCIKNNISPDRDGLAFRRVPVGDVFRVVWEADAIPNLDMDSVLNFGEPRGPGRPPAAREEAESFLLAELADGPRPSADIFASGRKEGHVKNTIYRAAESLGVVKKKTRFDGGWTWELPSEDSQIDY